MSPMHVVLYGAAAALPQGFAPPNPWTPKQQLRLVRDRWAVRFGQPRWIDYRNYVRPDMVNLGDYAIAQATAGLAQQSCRRALRFSRVNWGAALPDEPIDLLLVCGGGYLFVDDQGRLPRRIADDLACWKARRLPYALVGVGVNQLLHGATDTHGLFHPDSHGLVQELVAGSLGASVRDKATQTAVAAAAGLEPALIGDPALHLSDWIPAPRQARDRAARPRIGIDIPFHGPDAARRLRQDFSDYLRLVRMLRQSFDAELVFIAHFGAGLVVPELFGACGETMPAVYGDLPLLASAYASLDLVVAGMLHANILATSYGTPSIALAYDCKHRGFFELLGRPEAVLEAEPVPVQAVLDRARLALREGPHQAPALAQRRQQLALASKSFMREVLARLEDQDAG